MDSPKKKQEQGKVATKPQVLHLFFSPINRFSFPTLCC